MQGAKVWQIVVIVVGVLAILYLAWFFVKSRRPRPTGPGPEGMPMSTMPPGSVMGPGMGGPGGPGPGMQPGTPQMKPAPAPSGEGAEGTQ